uniref:Uncharacterized protein n=1 Tax=Accipiter nisus TaxID=211598 RepID=A0A8B9N3U2_9AVES
MIEGMQAGPAGRRAALLVNMCYCCQILTQRPIGFSENTKTCPCILTRQGLYESYTRFAKRSESFVWWHYISASRRQHLTSAEMSGCLEPGYPEAGLIKCVLVSQKGGKSSTIIYLGLTQALVHSYLMIPLNF